MGTDDGPDAAGHLFASPWQVGFMSSSRTALLAIMSGIGLGRTALAAGTALIATLVLGPAERGVMVVGLTVCSVAALGCSLGTGAGLRYLLPSALPAQRPMILAAYQWYSAAAAAVSAAIAVGVTVISARAIDPGLATPLFLVGVAIFAVASVVLQQATDLWFAQGMFRAGSTGALQITAGGLVGLAVGLVIGHTAEILLVAQATGMLVGCVWQLRSLARAKLVVAARPHFRDLSVIIRRGLPALGLTGGLVIALRADRYVLGLSAGPAAVGVYSLAATLAETARNVPTAVGQIFLRDTALGRGAAQLVRAGRVAFIGAAAAGGVVLLASHALLVPIFGPEFAEARSLLLLLVLAELCFVPFFVTSRGLVGGGWTTAAGVLGTVGGFVAIVAYVVAAGAFGAVGTAIASVAVYAGLSIGSSVLLRTRLKAAGQEWSSAVVGARRRRVVHVFGAMDRGGAELRTLEVVERLGRTEFDTVYVTLTGRAGELADRIRKSGDRVVPLSLDVRFPLKFVRLLRGLQADVVHSHVATFSGATLALARLAGVRTRIAHFRSDGDQRADTAVRRGQRAIMKFLLTTSATDIIGVSPGALDHGWRPGWRNDRRCRVICNGMDTRNLPPIADRQAARAELGLADDARVICHVGRPAAIKNRARAVDLVCHPAVAQASIVTLMVGSLADGEAQRWQGRADEGALRILGTRTDVLRILNAADLTLVTSTHEGLPGVVLESLAVGTPVVASDLPGVRWIADDVPGVTLRSLAQPDDVWAQSILSSLVTAGSASERFRLRSAFAEGRFLLDTAVTDLGALWRR